MTDVTYTGTVKGLIEKKGGWHAVEILVPGKQYPVKADTKLEQLLEQAREIRDRGVAATFTVSETESSNINPNSGKPYTERRLEKIEMNANVSPSTSAQDGGSRESARSVISDDERQRLIIRQSSLTRAIDAYGFQLGANDADNEMMLGKILETAGRFERWVYRDTSLDQGIPFV